MCYAKPGPRCSHHVKEELTRERAQLCNAERFEMERTASAQDGGVQENPWGNPVDIRARIVESMRVWDTTPQGQLALMNNIEFLESNNLTVLKNTGNPDENLSDLKFRLQVGAEIRKSSLEAYKKSSKNKKASAPVDFAARQKRWEEEGSNSVDEKIEAYNDLKNKILTEMNAQRPSRKEWGKFGLNILNEHPIDVNNGTCVNCISSASVGDHYGDATVDYEYESFPCPTIQVVEQRFMNVPYMVGK